MENHCSAWKAANLPSFPPGDGCPKENFDVAFCENFAVAAAMISDFSSEVILAVTKRLSSTDVLMREAYAALLSFRLVASTGVRHFLGEEDALR